MEQAIKFKDIKPYLSESEYYSICDHDTGHYDNYICLSDIPCDKDELYLYGIGLYEAEFFEKDDGTITGELFKGKLCWEECLEIVLSEKPKE